LLTEEEAQDFWGDGYVEFWNEDDGGYAAGDKPPLLGRPFGGSILLTTF